MRRAFWSAMPPQRIASTTCPAGAAATCSQLENRSLSCANARSELVSEVCCERTVATTSSMTGSTGLGANAPCSARGPCRAPSWVDGTRRPGARDPTAPRNDRSSGRQLAGTDIPQPHPTDAAGTALQGSFRAVLVVGARCRGRGVVGALFPVVLGAVCLVPGCGCAAL